MATEKAAEIVYMIRPLQNIMEDAKLDVDDVTKTNVEKYIARKVTRCLVLCCAVMLQKNTRALMLLLRCDVCVDLCSVVLCCVVVVLCSVVLC